MVASPETQHLYEKSLNNCGVLKPDHYWLGKPTVKHSETLEAYCHIQGSLEWTTLYRVSLQTSHPTPCPLVCFAMAVHWHNTAHRIKCLYKTIVLHRCRLKTLAK